MSAIKRRKDSNSTELELPKSGLWAYFCNWFCEPTKRLADAVDDWALTSMSYGSSITGTWRCEGCESTGLVIRVVSDFFSEPMPGVFFTVSATRRKLVDGAWE